MRGADIVVLATWSRTPILDEDDPAPGAHITSLGADEPGKAELTAGLLLTGARGAPPRANVTFDQ